MKTILTILLLLPLRSPQKPVAAPITSEWIVRIEESDIEGILKVEDNKGFKMMCDSGFILTCLIEKRIL